jgi:hypothetical protein
MQVQQPFFESDLILLPRYAIDARRRPTLERVEAFPQRIDCYVVQQGGELRTPPCVPLLAHEPAQATRMFPGSVSGTRQAGPCFPQLIAFPPAVAGSSSGRAIAALARSHSDQKPSPWFVGCSGTTRSSDSPKTCMSDARHNAFSDRSANPFFSADVLGGSRFPGRKFPRVLRVRLRGTRRWLAFVATADLAFRFAQRRRRPGCCFTTRYLACVCPCQRFAGRLAAADA